MVSSKNGLGAMGDLTDLSEVMRFIGGVLIIRVRELRNSKFLPREFNNIDIEDLKQECFLGLWAKGTFQQYDPNRDASWKTFIWVSTRCWLSSYIKYLTIRHIPICDIVFQSGIPLSDSREIESMHEAISLGYQDKVSMEDSVVESIICRRAREIAYSMGQTKNGFSYGQVYDLLMIGLPYRDVADGVGAKSPQTVATMKRRISNHLKNWELVA